MDIQIGEIIEGKDKYKVVEHLGTGGFASTYLGWETKTRMKVTIKLAITKNRDLKDVEAYHRREAAFIDIQSGYSSDMMQLIESIEDPENECYILISTYAHGTDFYKWLEEIQNDPPAKYFSYLVQFVFYPLADFFAYVHQHGILHRDITPSNVIISTRDDGGVYPVVIDWGGAINFDPAKYDEELPCLDKLAECPDQQIYTPGFEPPEINLSRTCNSRSDIYSFGVFMYYAFTNGHTRKRTRSKDSYCLSPKEVTSRCPIMLNDIVETCTEYEPTARYNTFGEIRDELAKYLTRSLGANFKRIEKPNKLLMLKKKKASNKA